MVSHLCNAMCSTVIEDPLMFCIDFEDDDLISDAFGIYRPWVLNDGVIVVSSPYCPQDIRCGYFNESILEVPFFSYTYNSWPSLRITFHYKQISNSTLDQGIISNDCTPPPFAEGNSLYCSAAADGDTFLGGLKSPAGGNVDLSAVSWKRDIQGCHRYV